MRDRAWTALLIGGPSGAGKSCTAYALAQEYGVSVLEIDDIGQALEAVTTAQTLPALHFWDRGTDWKDIGVAGNVDWLIRVGEEIAPALRAVVQNHLEGDVPIIIEGDFLHPELAASFEDARVKAFFVREADEQQMIRNYAAREGGEAQDFRAAISVAYGEWIADACVRLGLPLLEARPWDSVVDRAIASL